MIFDTHAHYDDKRFNKDRRELLSGLSKLGVEFVVNATSDYESMEKSLELTREYEFVYTTMGIHPSELSGLNDEVLAQVENNAKEKKCVAIGEIGLDYYWEKDRENRERQKAWFKGQLAIAKKLDLPVVIHSRDAAKDTLEILKEASKQGISCDIHCFSYSKEIAMEYIKMGFYLGIGGVLTFSNARKLREIVEEIPLASILLETDCPYLAPEPFRGERNDSSYLFYVVREIAKIKGTTEDEVINVTCKNAKNFYRL